MSAVDANLTIEEAAIRLGVSVATARRMAADGRIPATKAGKQWLVDGNRLGSNAPRRRVSSRPLVDLDRAVRHVVQTDLTEVWVPDVLRQTDVLADLATVGASAQARIEERSPGVAIEVEVDKTVFFTRWATLLGVEDRVAYQAVVASFADRVDAQTAECVFSARLSQSPRYFFRRGPQQWVAWNRYVRTQLTADQEWMIKTDLTSYFDVIPHHLLIAEVESLNVDRVIVEALAEMLRLWARAPGIGLPQGPNASRLLGNLYMLPVDRAMLGAGWNYSRYMDDVRIVTSTKADAVEAVRQFQRECGARALIVSSSKTTLLHGDDARMDLEKNADLTHVEYLMNNTQSSLARKELKRILKRALRSDVRIDERRARFSLWRLAQLREAGTLSLVMDRLEDLAPIATVVAAYLRPFISRRRVVKNLAAFLDDAARAHSSYLVTWLLAAMLEHRGTLPAEWADQASRRIKNRNEPAYLRAVAAIVMARGRRAADIAWIKADIQREHDPEVLRGYAVALHWVRALDNGTQRRLVSRSDRLASTIAYLKGRTVLPSLVYRETVLRLD